MKLDDWLEIHSDWKSHVDLVVMPPSLEESIDEFPEIERDAAQLYNGGHRWTSYGVTRLASYIKLRREGQGHAFAMMVSCQQSPRIMTDSVFFEGAKRLSDQFSDAHAQRLVNIARSHGYNPNPTDQYFSGLARFQGDPEAFVPASEGRGYIKRLCEKRGWACEGAVSAKHRQPERDPYETAPKLAPDLVASNAAAFAKANPDQARKMSKQDMAEHVVAAHGQSF